MKLIISNKCSIGKSNVEIWDLTCSIALGGSAVPEFGRSLVVLFIMELIGLGVLAFFVRRLELTGEGKELFVSKGQLLRDRIE